MGPARRTVGAGVGGMGVGAGPEVLRSEYRGKKQGLDLFGAGHGCQWMSTSDHVQNPPGLVFA